MSTETATGTSHGAVREMVPRRRSPSRASSQKRRPMECLPLLFAGIATSMYWRGEAVSQKAIVGMLAYAASAIDWWSVRGSVSSSRRGSRGRSPEARAPDGPHAALRS